MTQGGASAPVQVRLSSAPLAGLLDSHGNYSVTIGDNGAGLISFDGHRGSETLTFTASNWNVFQTVQVAGFDDGVVRGFHPSDLLATGLGNYSYLSTVTIGDNHYPGVTVTESGGTTNVVEYQNSAIDPSRSTLTSAGFPWEDSYTLSLTAAPHAGETVTVTAQAQPTRTSETGGILSFQQQLDVSLDGVNWYANVLVAFNSDGTGAGITGAGQDGLAKWNAPITVYVRAHENQRVDGGDTHVFAPELDTLSAIQGPLFVNGGEGQDRTGLLEREPVMLPGEKNITPPMGRVISSTPGTTDGTIAATVTIEHSTLPSVSVSPEPGTNNTVQTIAVDAISGTFEVNYGTSAYSAPIAWDAPAVTVENALRKLLPSGWDVTVSANGAVYQVTISGAGTEIPGAVANVGVQGENLGPTAPSQLVGQTILITTGPAKNKSRIVTGGIVANDGSGNWVLTLDKAWFSPFTNDASTPTSDSTYAFEQTNPNLLVDEKTQANLLYLYDDANPASYNDPAWLAQHPGTDNPFGSGQIFYDTNQFGPADEHGNIAPLDEFRITGFGMGGNRCIGGPSQQIDAANAEAIACAGPVGANEPGGISFEGISDLQLELGAGNNHVVVDTFANVPTSTGVDAPLTRIDTGAGNDRVDVKGITGHTFVNLGAGNDTLNVGSGTVGTTSQTLSEIGALLTASGDSPQANVVALVNGSAAQGTAVSAVDEIERLTIDATGGTYTLTLPGFGVTTAAIAWNAPATGAGSLQSMLATALGTSTSNLDVQVHGNVYRIHFTGTLGGRAIPLLVTDPSGLTNGAGETDTLVMNDQGATADASAILTSTSLTGLDMPNANATQQLVVDATSGTYTLINTYGVAPTHLVGTQAGGGTLHAGTWYYKVTGVSGAYESLASNEISVVTASNGSVSLTWSGITDVPVGSYNVYRGTTEGGENTLVRGGITGTSFTDTGGGSTGSLANAGTLLATETTSTPLPYNATAAQIQSALEHLAHIGVGNVVVQQNDDVYTISFQGSLSDTPIHPLTTTANLGNSVELLGGGTQNVTGTAVVTVRTPGSSTSEVNQEQLLSVSATSGSYELQFHVNGVPYTTAPIAYNASAEQLRQTIQNAIAVGRELRSEPPGLPGRQARRHRRPLSERLPVPGRLRPQLPGRAAGDRLRPGPRYGRDRQPDG